MHACSYSTLLQLLIAEQLLRPVANRPVSVLSGVCSFSVCC